MKSNVMVTHYVTLQWSHMGYRRCHIGCTLVTECTIIDRFQVPYMTLFVVHVWPMDVWISGHTWVTEYTFIGRFSTDCAELRRFI